MSKVDLLHVFQLMVLLELAYGSNRLAEIRSVDGYFDICMDGVYQKKQPKAEQLYGQCSEWKDRNCCFENTTRKLQIQDKWQGFDLNHCSKNLSLMCKGHFIQNYCFYECSPNVGPWLVKVSGMESRKERFYKVPLCKQECDLWWKDCEEDFTCVKNWETDFMWDTGINQCPKSSSCKRFKDIYTDAKDFCESVFDFSYKVVQESVPCMKLNFHNNNPNYAVARQQAESFFTSQSNYYHSSKKVFTLSFLFMVITRKWIC